MNPAPSNPNNLAAFWFTSYGPGWQESVVSLWVGEGATIGYLTISFTKESSDSLSDTWESSAAAGASSDSEDMVWSSSLAQNPFVMRMGAVLRVVSLSLYLLDRSKGFGVRTSDSKDEIVLSWGTARVEL